MSFNDFEVFDAQKQSKSENADFYIRREKAMEKIELAYAKVKEQFGKYEGCADFIEYLRTMEKIFTEARMKNWDVKACEDELIGVKITLIANESKLPRGIFDSIYEDFKFTNRKINNISKIAELMLGKYKDPDEQELINYIQYIFTNFEDKTKNSDEIKAALIRARMRVLSADGNPELMNLEKIYQEFNRRLKG
jgi:hypothetical protein